MEHTKITMPVSTARMPGRSAAVLLNEIENIGGGGDGGRDMSTRPKQHAVQPECLLQQEHHLIQVQRDDGKTQGVCARTGPRDSSSDAGTM